MEMPGGHVLVYNLYGCVTVWPRSRLHPVPLNVAEAQRLKVCRICRLRDAPSLGNPLVLNYWAEYAHAECLKQQND